jgi:Putative abortive phage resistance protein AbiGi, antitoxin
MSTNPGTVSKILWHFTGGPLWDDVAKRQLPEPKPAEKGYEALLAILGSRELRVGRYRELINAHTMWSQATGPASIVVDPKREMTITVESVQVACVADIPIMHINYHALRYGKIAIGFHRISLIRHGFTPVSYQYLDSHVLQKIYETYSTLNVLKSLLQDQVDATEGTYMGPIAGYTPPTPTEIIQRATITFQEFLASVKTFTPEEFETIYCEREWRAIKSFTFDYSHISMIVLPRDGGYFERFIGETESIGVPKTVSVVAWEDLIEN